MGWAIALAAAAMTPAAAGAQTPPAARPQPVAAAPAPAAPAPVAAPADAVAAPAAAPAPAIDHVAPTPGIGLPDGRMGLQDQVTEVGQQAASFHNNWLLLMCAAISVFVLVLLVWTILRYRRGANPTPARTSHNTMIEVIWTLVPVLILVAIAIPSIRLIRAQYSPPPADLTVKVIGNQWYWTYQYPDNGGFEIVSNLLKEQKDVKAGDRYRTDADGPALLAVDERLVIPAGKVVKFIVTSNDVIHAFAVPAFWTKIDANPGRLNETWVKVDRPGVYFGQCSELCGARHGYMPIAIEVVPEATFNAWLASKGGAPKGAAPTPAEASAPAEATAAAAAPAPEPAAEEPTTNQPAVAQN
ncbi:MAG TPA: cytochrome c oxidase subunit II [Sphingomicrobium sp.]|nr:cytochrome c oxidase subunit II [Sphingomicrobium sp.]